MFLYAREFIKAHGIIQAACYHASHVIMQVLGQSHQSQQGAIAVVHAGGEQPATAGSTQRSSWLECAAGQPQGQSATGPIQPGVRHDSASHVQCAQLDISFAPLG